MMFMSTLTKKSRLKPCLVAEKAEEKKRNKFSISDNKIMSHLLMKMRIIYFQIFYSIL